MHMKLFPCTVSGHVNVHNRNSDGPNSNSAKQIIVPQTATKYMGKRPRYLFGDLMKMFDAGLKKSPSESIFCFSIGFFLTCSSCGET
jgi:hypothetical protein